jgi:hypothetical protein
VLLAVVLALAQGAVSFPKVVARCEVRGDPAARVYELQSDSARTRWRLVMRGRNAGNSPVLLPLPDAKPTSSEGSLSLNYRTLNGGREVRWQVGASGATLDVHANFELEVNVEADLDPRVELMNTEGPVACR